MQLVHSDALQFHKTVDSYWEASADPLKTDLEALRTDVSCDVAIIGGGYTGLTAAIELARLGVDVCVLEAGAIGWGASGRNGGFACVGSHKLSYPTMIKTFGLDAAKHYYSTMRDSIDQVAQTCADFGIDAWQHGSGEVCLAHKPDRMEQFRREQGFMRETFGEKLELLSRDDLQDRGLAGPEFHGGLKNGRGFGLHPLNYVRGLARAVAHLHVKLHPFSRVMRWHQNDGKHHLYTEQAQVAAKRVLVATNGYTQETLSRDLEGRFLPVLSNIIVTRQLTKSELQDQGWTSSTMAYDSRRLLHYFRLLPNNRFLFGGRGGTDSSYAADKDQYQHITQRFRSYFPAWRNVEISHFWRGFVCLSYDRVPYLGPLDESKTVWTALAYHGNGVAMATWSGPAVARLMTGKAGSTEVPSVITRRLARFPLPMFRPLYLKGAYLWYGWQDRC